MQFWRGTLQPGGATGKPHNGGADPGSKHYGSRADGKHNAVRDVFLAVQSHGCCCYRCRHGSAYTDAVHSDDYDAVDTGCANGADSEYAGARQYV